MVFISMQACGSFSIVMVLRLITGLFDWKVCRTVGNTKGKIDRSFAILGMTEFTYTFIFFKLKYLDLVRLDMVLKSIIILFPIV